MDTQNQPEMKFTTSDGIEFSIVTNDVIELTEAQFDEIVTRVVRWKASYVINSGIDITTLTEEQANAVMNIINCIVGKSENPIAEKLVVLSDHVFNERMNNDDVLHKRGWFRDSADEIQADIANVVKNVREVQKAKLQFNPSKLRSREKFTFTILGLKVNGEDGRLSIVLMEDDRDFVLVVTIL
jgi:hypothetical protein